MSNFLEAFLKDEWWDLGFSEDVLEALIAITKTKKESYSDYIERVSKNDYATQVKIADLEHNMDITTTMLQTI